MSVGNSKITDLIFADDAVIFAESHAGDSGDGSRGTPPGGSHLVVVGRLVCPKYLESYARGGFTPCSPPLWGERVSHVSKVCQGRARLNGSHELGRQYGLTVPTARRAVLYGMPCVGWLAVWAGGRWEGGLSTVVGKLSDPWGLLFKSSSPVGDEVPAHGGQRSVPSSVR